MIPMFLQTNSICVKYMLEFYKPNSETVYVEDLNYFYDHFKIKEFRCKCGCRKGYNFIPVEIFQFLIKLRRHVGVVFINSAYRCLSHNKSIGGADKSQHTYGFALDVRDILKQNRDIILHLAKENNLYYIEYENFVHIDCRKLRISCA